MDEFSPKIRALIERTRAEDDPSGQDRLRVRRKLAITAAPLVGTVGASLAAKSAAAATGAKAAGLGAVALVKWTAGCALAAAVAVGAYETMDAERERPTQGAEGEGSRPTTARGPGERMLGQKDPTGAENVAEKPPEEVVLNRTYPPRGRPPEGTRTGKSGGRVSAGPPPGVGAKAVAEPRSEVDLLALAQGKLTRGQGAEALELVEAHRREFPRSALGAERLAVRVLALCQLGRTSEAESALAEFERVAPASPLRPRLLASCAGASRHYHDSNTIPPLSGN